MIRFDIEEEHIITMDGGGIEQIKGDGGIELAHQLGNA